MSKDYTDHSDFKNWNKVNKNIRKVSLSVPLRGVTKDTRDQSHFQ